MPGDKVGAQLPRAGSLRVAVPPAWHRGDTQCPAAAESVPSPRTRSKLLASTVEWCNLTLQCQGAGRGAVNVTWKRDSLGRGGSGGELGTDRHQLSPED